MSICIALISISGASINTKKSPEIIMHDEACDEIKKTSQQLQLPCLRFFDGAMDTVFNYVQSKHILTTEIPALRALQLSDKAVLALNEVEKLLKEMDSVYWYLYCEGD